MLPNLEKTECEISIVIIYISRVATHLENWKFYVRSGIFRTIDQFTLVLTL